MTMWTCEAERAARVLSSPEALATMASEYWVPWIEILTQMSGIDLLQRLGEPTTRQWRRNMDRAGVSGLPETILGV